MLQIFLDPLKENEERKVTGRNKSAKGDMEQTSKATTLSSME